jgi:ABC-type transport system involved in multi-copper enzyme maturation permease subunit
VRLLRAEMLKIVRRRGLMVWTAILTIGAVLVTEAILILLHAFNPAHHGPAGGQANLSHYLDVLLGLGTIAAIMVGATAGSQDVANGVFRDLVVTGRSRSALFNVRAPGALLVLLPIVAVGFLLAVAGAFLFSGSLNNPSGRVVGDYAAFVLASIVLNVVLAVGLSSIVSARVVIGVLIGWNVIVGPLLAQIGSLGSVRKGLDIAAIDHFGPAQYVNDDVKMSTLTALVVLAVWIAVFNAAGRASTGRRDA